MTLRTSRAAPVPPVSSGKHADFYVIAVDGLGQAADVARVEALLDSLKPDVVMVQACPTRLALASDMASSSSSLAFWAFKFGSHRALVAWLWRRLAERGCALLGRSDLPFHVVGQDWSDTIGLAADRHIRVVLGDRDIIRTADHAWNRLSFVSRVLVVLELVLCSIVPAWLMARLISRPPGSDAPLNLYSARLNSAASADASNLVDTESGDVLTGGDGTSLPVSNGRHRGTDEDVHDPFTAAVRHFGQRFSGLAGLAEEQEDYLLSSLDRLDAPLSTLCTTCLDRRRARVLAVLGPSMAHAMEARLSDLSYSSSSLSNDDGAGSSGAARRKHNRAPLSSTERRNMVRASSPSWRSSLLLPVAIALSLVGVPLLYASALFHAHLAPSLADTLQTLAASSTRTRDFVSAGSSGNNRGRQQGFYTDAT